MIWLLVHQQLVAFSIIVALVVDRDVGRREQRPSGF